MFIARLNDEAELRDQLDLPPKVASDSPPAGHDCEVDGDCQNVHPIPRHAANEPVEYPQLAGEDELLAEREWCLHCGSDECYHAAQHNAAYGGAS
jgi:hypothetical protein